MPGDPVALADALRALGLACDVEAEGALAILVPHAQAAMPPAEQRSEIVRAARQAGFANVALEVRASQPAAPQRDV